MKLLFAALALCGLMQIPAQAAVVTYEFSATVRRISQFLPSQVDYIITQGPAPGSVVFTGNTITGRFQFDTATPASAPPIGNFVQGYYSSTSKNGWSVTMPGGHTYVSTSSVALTTGNYGYYGFQIDSPTVSTTNMQNGVGARLDFYATGLDFTSFALPKDLSLDVYNPSYLTFEWLRPSDQARIWSLSKLDSLTLISVVPEPKAYAMLAFGLCIALAAGRRQRHSRAS